MHASDSGHTRPAMIPSPPPVTPRWWKRLWAGGVLPALVATTLWSTVFVLARVLAGQVPPAELAFWRWAIAFMVLAPFTWSASRREWPVMRRHLGFLTLAGTMGFAVFSLVVFKAGESTSATNLSLIAASAPVIIAVLSVLFLREPLRLRPALGLCIALSGVLLLVLKGDLRTLTRLDVAPGDAWMLLAALMFALYSIMIRKRPAGLSQGPLLAAMLALASLALAPLCLWTMLEPGYSWPKTEYWLAMVFMGIGPSSLAYLCWNVAVERIGAARSGVVYYSVPLFSSLEAALWLGESVTVPQIVGGLLIVSGIVLSSLDSLRHTPPRSR